MTNIKWNQEKNYYRMLLKKYEMESRDDLTIRIKHFLDKLEQNKCKKIIVVSHGGIINAINKYLLNSYASINGDLSNGSNCHITMYIYDRGEYKLVIPPNTLHFYLV